MAFFSFSGGEELARIFDQSWFPNSSGPAYKNMIYFNTASRAACISIINYIAQESDWLAIPLDIDGNLLMVFVRKSCTRGTGYRNAADLFDREGCASKTAELIGRIAQRRGTTRFEAGTTGCCRLVEAVAEIERTEEIEALD